MAQQTGTDVSMAQQTGTDVSMAQQTGTDAIKPIEYKNINKITSQHLLELKEDNMMSVDLYLRNYAWLKQQELNKFEKKLISSS
jgi:hypothetical protein